MIVRKALNTDIDFVVSIYDKIHDLEENGDIVIGWVRSVYPTRSTAEEALKRDDLFVMEQDGRIVGAGIINQTQVDAYEKGNWRYPADPSNVMVLHTLVIDPDEKRKGYGRYFVKFYEDFAKQAGCKYLRMDTNEKNARARSFYKSIGYEEIGCVPCIFNGIEGVNLVLIEKDIKDYGF